MGPFSLCFVQATRRGLELCDCVTCLPARSAGVGSCFILKPGRPRMGAALSQRSFPYEKVPEDPHVARRTLPLWHADFEKMIPIIERHAKVAFRHLGREGCEEMVQEVVCNCCQAYVRLVEQGKTDRAFPTALAKFAICQACEGRKVGGTLNVRDISANYCQKKKNLLLERLDRYDSEEQAWSEILVEDQHAGPAETAIVQARLLRLAEAAAAPLAEDRHVPGQGRNHQRRRQAVWCFTRQDFADPRRVAFGLVCFSRRRARRGRR